MYLRTDSRLEPPQKKRGQVLKRAASGLTDDGSFEKFVGHDDHATRMGKSQYWEQIWKAGVPEGTHFDKGSSCKALAHFLKEEPLGKSIPRSGSVLVPGCGRGYDCELLASEGFAKVDGIELSSAAVDAANSWLRDHGQSMTVQRKNFFDVDNEYDLIFDCGLFTALHPHARSAWAKKMIATTKPNGYLVCLVFPISHTLQASFLQFFRTYFKGEPPYPTTVSTITDLLTPHFDIVFTQDPLPPAIAHLHNNALAAASALVVFKKKPHLHPPARRTLSGENAIPDTQSNYPGAE